MTWLTRIKAVLGARWFLPVLTLALSVVIGAFGWGWSKGYDTAETRHQAQLSAALESQLEQERKRSARELELAVKTERAKHEAQRKINAVPRPAVSCDLPAECVQWYDDILQAAGADIDGTD